MIKAALLALAASTLVTGCLPGGTCGAFQGGRDKVLARDSDSIVLCENGGYVASVNGTVHEGRQVVADVATDIVGTDGPTGATSFVLTYENDFTTATTTDLGDGDWSVLALDTTALDHADVQCQDLVSRSWW
ncbi:MAG TPA: hypothetical protein VGC41_02075 [Kofleriaceae bacterium]